MNDKPLATIDQLESQLQRRMCGHIRGLRILVRDQGLVLEGYARSYYAKQLAQEIVKDSGNLPLKANDIQVL